MTTRMCRCREGRHSSREGDVKRRWLRHQGDDDDDDGQTFIRVPCVNSNQQQQQQKHYYPTSFEVKQRWRKVKINI